MIPSDHVLAAMFGIGFPLVGIPLYDRRPPALLAGDSGTERREYLETIAWLAGMGAATVGRAGLYLLSGALWAPMLLHASIDLSNGATGMSVLSTREPDPA